MLQKVARENPLRRLTRSGGGACCDPSNKLTDVKTLPLTAIFLLLSSPFWE